MKISDLYKIYTFVDKFLNPKNVNIFSMEKFLRNLKIGVAKI